MRIAGRVYVLSATIALVAMVSRTELADWQPVGLIVAMGLVALAACAALLCLVAVVIGLPVLLILAVREGVLRPMPETRAGEPPT